MPKKGKTEERGGHKKRKNEKVPIWRKLLCKKTYSNVNISKNLKNIRH